MKILFIYPGHASLSSKENGKTGNNIQYKSWSQKREKIREDQGELAVENSFHLLPLSWHKY